MLDKIRKINIKKAGICSVTIGIINIIVHILIITQTMPYTWVNGGRSVSFELASCQILVLPLKNVGDI